MIQKIRRLPLPYPHTISVWTRVIFGIVLFTGWCTLSGQSEELTREQASLQKEIGITQELIRKNRGEKASVTQKMSLLDKQIETRERLLESIQKDLSQINEQKSSAKDKIEILTEKKEKLHVAYGEILMGAYKAKLLRSEWLFLFSAQTLPQIYHRWRYLRKLNSGIKQRLIEVRNRQSHINSEIEELTAIEREKNILVTRHRDQKAEIEKVRKLQDELLTTLVSAEGTLQKQLKKQKRAQKLLRKEIERLISKSSGGSDLPLTPAMTALASSFEANKGRLPWPVTRGVVTRKYGNQRHPSLRNVTITNNGIDLSTEKNLGVQAIFNGTVVGAQHIPGHDQMVIVSHGSYYSVYSYMTKLTIEVGDKVETGDILGYPREKGGIAELHLEIWSGKKMLNPELWLGSPL